MLVKGVGIDVTPIRGGSGERGLTDTEARERLVRWGPNELARHGHSSLLRQIVLQLTSPLALLLWAAAVLSLVTGALSFGVVVVLVVLLNTAFAVLQERQAEHALELLREYLPPHARVRRNGTTSSIEARTVVPGDVLLVAEGERICADGTLIAGSLRVDASALTGESAPVTVSATSSDDRRAFSGTLCVSGVAELWVEQTGMRTEIGRIATLTERVTDKRSPLEQQVRRATTLIAIVSVSVGLAFVPIGVAAGLTLTGAAVFAIGLLVANVPEGLLPTITLALAAGVRSLARRRALVKRLSAVETLGSTNVICTDKTGTLTMNRLRVEQTWLVDEAGAHLATEDDRARLKSALLVGALCSDADETARHGDPTELALMEAAATVGASASVLERTQTRRAEFSFDPTLRRMTTVSEVDDLVRVDTKGAPEALLDLCVPPDAVDDALGWRRLVLDAVDKGASQGLRMIALATRQLDGLPAADAERSSVERELQLVGLCGLSDTLREEVPAAVVACKRAGIRIVVITGDHGLTARAITHQAGIAAADARIVTGKQLDLMSDAALTTLLDSGEDVVFARSSPETKLRIARALQDLGLVVAMTGDGVNDAPALQQADIGIAMGRSGTDVAREAAEIVLTDDNFATIVEAVMEGRRVYENLRKFVVYVFAHATPEMVPFLVFAVSGGNIPLGITAAQILAIDLGTETLPALALGRERAEPDIMDRPPRHRDQNLLTWPMLARAWLLLGGISAACVYAAYLIVLVQGGWHPGDATGPGSPLYDVHRQATTITFLGIVSCQIGTAFASRTERSLLRDIGITTNPLLLWGIAFELIVAAAVVYVPPLQTLFNTTPVTLAQFTLILPFPIIVWGADELWRWLHLSAIMRAGRAAGGA